MPFVFLFAALGLAACSAAPPAPSSPSRLPAPDAALPHLPMTLFDFTSTDDADWTIENDGVMGGRSKGYVEIEDGTMRFTGTVVTQGGGFTSVRAFQDADLSGFDGVELRVRGSGRTFEIDFFDGSQDRGRDISRRVPFPTEAEWKTVRAAFDDIQVSVHGEPVDAPPFDPSALQSIGIYIIDGQDGPFELEVDWIRTTRDGDDG